MGSKSLIGIVKKGRRALAKWRRANPDGLLNLSDADLQNVDLRGANLKRADLTGTDLRGSNLVGANFTEADLTRADLRDAKLVKADFYNARLFKATFAGSDCSGAHLRRAEAIEADFSGVNLTKADLVEMNLRNGSLAEATLIGADLSRARLSGVDIREAVFGWTVLGDVDLTQLVGIDQLEHVGPSTLGLDTARLSHDRLSESFLQGCGVSESVVQQWESLFGHPCEEIPCFIRFAPDDSSFAKNVFKVGQQKGLRCWLDEMPKDAAKRRNHNSPTTYETNERVLFCVSKASLESWWGHDEIERIQNREKRAKEDTGRDERLFFPLNLDGFMFSGDWNHPQEKQLAKLTIDFVGWRRNKEKFEQEMTGLIQLMMGDKAKKKK